MNYTILRHCVSGCWYVAIFRDIAMTLFAMTFDWNGSRVDRSVDAQIIGENLGVGEGKIAGYINRNYEVLFLSPFCGPYI